MVAHCADARSAVIPVAQVHPAAHRLGFSAASGPSVGLVSVLAAAGIGTARLISPARAEAGPVICPFRRLTGLPCPGCGLTRSWVDLMHGRVADAMAANAFGIVALALAVLLLVAVGSALLRGRALPSYADLVTRGWWTRPVGAVLALAWICFGAVRLIVVAG